MIHNQEQSNAFWHEHAKERAPFNEPLVLVLPDFMGIGYINDDFEIVSTDVTINGCDSSSITYWAELPDFPNAY